MGSVSGRGSLNGDLSQHATRHVQNRVESVEAIPLIFNREANVPAHERVLAPHQGAIGEAVADDPVVGRDAESVYTWPVCASTTRMVNGAGDSSGSPMIHVPTRRSGYAKVLTVMEGVDA